MSDADTVATTESTPGASARRARSVQGSVESARMDKTITVLVERQLQHPLYKKYIRRATRLHAHDAASRANAKGVANLKNVEARLNGKVVGVGAAPSLPLSAEGQAQRLIADATAVDNLARMFIWWMPWC